MPSTNPDDELKDDGLQVNLPDCLPASSRADKLDRPIPARAIQHPDPNYAALLKRVEDLELHRLGLIFVAVVACLASITCLYIMRQGRSAESGTVEVKRLVFLDPASGTRRDSIRLDESGTGIAFCDANGVKRSLFYTSPEGSTWMHLRMPEGKQRVSIGVLNDGGGHVDVCDEGAKHVVFLDSRGLSLYEERAPRGLFTNVDGVTGISIFDTKGAPLFKRP